MTCIEINGINKFLILSKIKSQWIGNILMYSQCMLPASVARVNSMSGSKFGVSFHWSFFLELFSSRNTEKKLKTI